MLIWQRYSLMIVLLLSYNTRLQSPAGLSNVGNTCYINSTLQCLFACGPFVRLLESVNVAGKLPAGSIGDELNKLMMTHIVGAGHPKSFIECLEKSTLLGNLAIRAQQDASEFFTALLSRLNEIDQAMEDLFELRAECITPQRKPKHPTSILTLMPDRNNSLQGLISDYMRHGNFLEPCASQFLKMPEILVIKLERVTSAGVKNMSTIPYDLSPLVFNVDRCQEIYLPIGCIFHAGASSASGHYTAVVNHDNQWYYCDDDRVQLITESQVVAWFGDKKGLQAPLGQPVLMFFQKVECVQLQHSQLVDLDLLTNLLTQFTRELTCLYLQSLVVP